MCLTPRKENGGQSNNLSPYPSTATSDVQQRQVRQEEAPCASPNPFFFIPALRQGPLNTEQHEMWTNRTQIAKINLTQVGLILKINKLGWQTVCGEWL